MNDRKDRAPRGHELITRGPTKVGDKVFVSLGPNSEFVGWGPIPDNLVGRDATMFEGVARRVGQP